MTKGILTKSFTTTVILHQIAACRMTRGLGSSSFLKVLKTGVLQSVCFANASLDAGRKVTG